jgi:hypothetical protein
MVFERDRPSAVFANSSSLFDHAVRGSTKSFDAKTTLSMSSLTRSYRALLAQVNGV